MRFNWSSDHTSEKLCILQLVDTVHYKPPACPIRYLLMQYVFDAIISKELVPFTTSHSPFWIVSQSYCCLRQ